MLNYTEQQADIIEGLLKADARTYCETGNMPTKVYGLHDERGTVHMAEPHETTEAKLTEFDIDEQKRYKWLICVELVQERVAKVLGNKHIPTAKTIAKWADKGTTLFACADGHIEYWAERG